ncbi:uncharacterized protein LOC114527409 [Dendronephthya gigantea]|uniref:uncharacterized protein LOC114527409 n=1 Tax=Dendronephthya gigantea TaxID=151771 RepID=UPI00106BF6FB|nr:uncharacterized protein LOC114527409 [Dendronephthya gigantea]
MFPNTMCGVFLSCLQFAILNSLYSEVILKPKQVICLEKIFLNLDIIAILPTGYGKSLIFCLIPALLFAKKNGVKCPGGSISSIVIVVSPLNALIENQISRLSSSGIRASALGVKSTTKDDVDDSEESICDFSLIDREKLEAGYYNIVFAHPESFVSCTYGRKLMHTTPYQENVCAIVVDEAHCILNWGKDFRVDYSNLAVLCATFANVPVMAMTATATKRDREEIKNSLDIKDCSEVVGNPDRRNIMYEKHFRVGSDIDSLTSILTPMAQGLLEKNICYPLTIIYIPLRWCGFAYKIFESVLGINQYHPKGSRQTPENRLFAQFHSPQTTEMKDMILKQLCSSQSTVRVIFATVALGMGIDIRGIRCIVHITPPYTIQAYFQETGRAGRDGQPATAVLYYNNRDIAKNKPGMQEAVRRFCKTKGECLRHVLLSLLDTDKKYFPLVTPKHLCCDVGMLECECSSCMK